MRLDGYDSRDTLDYSELSFSIEAKFYNPNAGIIQALNGSSTKIDVVQSFERIIGTNFDDKFIGGGDIVFIGNGGNNHYQIIGSQIHIERGSGGGSNILDINYATPDNTTAEDINDGVHLTGAVDLFIPNVYGSTPVDSIFDGTTTLSLSKYYEEEKEPPNDFDPNKNKDQDGNWIPGKLLPDMDAAHAAAIPIPIGDGTVSPLVIDLDNDGIELTSLAVDAVYWDADNDGFREASAWVKSDDGLLALDRNGNGAIDNHSELFGTKNVDGFTILRELDGNKDNKIDATDGRFAELKIWRDLNQDGVSQTNELQTLAQAGVKSINLNAALISNRQIEGNDVTHASQVTMTNGTTREIVDAWFKTDRANKMYSNALTLKLSGLSTMPEIYF